MEELLVGVLPTEVNQETGIFGFIRLPLEKLSQDTDTKPRCVGIWIKHAGWTCRSSGEGRVITQVAIAPVGLKGQTLQPIGLEKLPEIELGCEFFLIDPIPLGLIGEPSGDLTIKGLLGSSRHGQSVVLKRIAETEPVTESTGTVPPLLHG